MAIIEYVSPKERERISNELTDAICRDASEEELDRISAKLPILPGLALNLKETRGVKGLLATNFNLYDAVQEYGEDFLKE